MGMVLCYAYLSRDLPTAAIDEEVSMELEKRVEKLEHETDILKSEIKRTLLDVQRNLLEQPTRTSRWQKSAWGLALLNVLMAITLFANIRLYEIDKTSSEISSTWDSWLRAFWIALAFLWMILQMYPLALLLEEEDQQLRGVALRNAVGLLVSNPALTVLLTLMVLIVAVVSMLFPPAWFIVMVALLIIACVNIVLHSIAPHILPRNKGEQNERED